MKTENYKNDGARFFLPLTASTTMNDFGILAHRDKEYMYMYCGINTGRLASVLPWAEAHCRGHMLSARHSTNHLGEGLRQEPIVTLAGYHLIRVSE